ncbi:oligosaccharide flippase family protein [Pseudoalteromonas sp. S201]|uniref:oligosaccharide flippase family protein n=1 Tax=Pseudoalteromonas sp. S201 TaxID=579519 RepID=UPI00110C95EE|nr:oligosaccharide flippase family protein [Pseudoalteromonas sp. S201]
MTDSLKKRYTLKLIANIIAGLINIIIVAIVPKALGPIVYGQFVYIQQFFTQIIAFLDAGTSTAFFTKISANQSRKELISFYFVFSLLLLLTLFGFVYTLELSNTLETFLTGIPTNFVYLGVWFGFLTWFTQVYIKISDAYALTVSVEVVKISHKIIMLVALLYCINSLVFDLQLYFYYHFLSLLVFISVVTLLFFKKGIYSSDLVNSKIEMKKISLEFLSFSSPLFVFNMIAIGISLFDLWLLQRISGSIETGYYGLAYSIAAMCFLFTSAMTPLITRELSKAYAENRVDEMRRLFSRYVPMLYAIAAYFGAFIAFSSEGLLEIFTDERFKDAHLTLMVIAFYPIHQTYGQLNSALFFAIEKTTLYRNIGILSSIIGLVFTFLFIYLFELGAVGFAWKMIISQIIGVNIQLFVNVIWLKLRFKSFVIHQLYSTIFFMIIALISTNVLKYSNDLIANFLVSGIAYTLLVFVGIILMPSIVKTNRQELLALKERIIQVFT